jgi:hypothetical protein
MTTAADQFDDTLSPTDLQFGGYLANSLAQLLETARRELERDSEAAKAIAGHSVAHPASGDRAR